MLKRGLAAAGLAAMLVLSAVGCSQSRPGARTDQPEIHGSSEYTYDRMGFQIDPNTGGRLDSAYNRRLEIEIGR
jgi:outer membrane protein OmpA-like peptidoglycan-associated protein